MELGNLIFGHSRGICPVPRGFTSDTYEWQERFIKFLDRIGCDGYGFIDDITHPARNSRGGVTTELFEIKPYYWGDDEDEEEAPNFVYFPSNYELRWYKYPLRDSYANNNLTYKEFKAMLKDCEKYWEKIYG